MQTWTPDVSGLQMLSARDVAGLVNAIGSSDRVAMASAVLQAVRTVAQVQHCTIMVHEAGRNPRLLSGAGETGPWIAFQCGAHCARETRASDALCALVEHRPALTAVGRTLLCGQRRTDVPEGAYRRDCLDRFSLDDRVSIVTRTGESTWLVVHLFRSEQHGPFGPDDIRGLLGIATVVSCCVARHFATDVDGIASYREKVSDEVGEICPTLTGREREVLLRILDGVTVTRIAEDLKLRPTTVATYRTRAYEKLGVATRCELFAAVLRRKAVRPGRALAAVRAGGDGVAPRFGTA